MSNNIRIEIYFRFKCLLPKYSRYAWKGYHLRGITWLWFYIGIYLRKNKALNK